MRYGATIGQREVDDREESGLVTSEAAGGAPPAYWEDRHNQRGPLAMRHNLRRAVSYLEREGHLSRGSSIKQN